MRGKHVTLSYRRECENPHVRAGNSMVNFPVIDTVTFFEYDFCMYGLCVFRGAGDGEVSQGAVVLTPLTSMAW